MEFFDFEEASFASSKFQDDVASDRQEVDEGDAVDNFDSLFFDKTFQLHPDLGLTTAENDSVHNQGPISDLPEGDLLADPNSEYPMFRTKEPCDFCRQMGFDCFLIKRGVLNNGCTCCVALYRECSFTHAKTPGKYLHTLHPVGEDDVTSTGGLTGRRALKSAVASKFDHLESLGRKSGARFSRDAVRILKNWLSEHSQHPYPTEEEKNELKQRTGLKRSQIANWLANSRRRGKVPRSGSPDPGAVDIPTHTRSSSTSSTGSTSSNSNLEYALMTPFERWKHSPPEHEAASTSAIIRALANESSLTKSSSSSPSHSLQQHQNYHAPQSMSSHNRSISRKGSSNNSDSMFQTPSVSSFEVDNKSAASDYSIPSAFSHLSSQHSINSTDRKERRRRRKQIPPVPAFERQPVRGARIFQCTFCTDSFPAKYDWQRHEKSVHLALEKWTCAPNGAVITTSDGQKACAFCRAPDPTKDHLENHNFSICQEKTLQERTFYRKDHLNQHLRLMHDVKYDSSMDNWRSTTNDITSRCGFCDTNFVTWRDRVDHIAQHFKNGADMAKWKGDWGFELYVQRLVENSTPPYLIASERANQNQDRQSALDHSKNTSNIATRPATVSLLVTEDVTSFERLENELKAFIGCQLLDGLMPTDKNIQDQGRMIVYGSNDPWNLTCADNAVWLNVLKRDCGIEDLVGLENIKLQNLGMQPPFAGALQSPPIETNKFVTGVVHRSLFGGSNFGSRGFPASGLQSPGFFSGSGFQSDAPSMPGSLTGSVPGSIGVSSVEPLSGMSGLTRGWSNNFSVGDQSLPDWQGNSAFADTLVQSDHDLDLLGQLNDLGPQSMAIDAPAYSIDGLTSQAEMMPHQILPLSVPTAEKNKQLFDPTAVTMASMSETQPISIPTTTAAAPSNNPNPNMHQYFDTPYSSQPGFR